MSQNRELKVKRLQREYKRLARWRASVLAQADAKMAVIRVQLGEVGALPESAFDGKMHWDSAEVRRMTPEELTLAVAREAAEADLESAQAVAPSDDEQGTEDDGDAQQVPA